MIRCNPIPLRSIRGFSLVELTIVLVIASLLAGGLMFSISAQQENIANSETQRRLNDARDALLGYAAANGRLPCPAAAATTGVEAPAGGGTCSNAWDGFLPGISLGLAPTNEAGYVLDGWGNPIRYAVATDASAQVTTQNQIKAAWNTGTALVGNLQVCNSATGMAGSGNSASCASGAELTNNAVAVIFSRGKNGGVAPGSTDEQANGDADRLFVWHTPTPTGPTEFDDIVIWLSPNILYNRLIAAGRLP